MNFLEERIVKDGVVKEGNILKVDSFLNHQMDINLFDQLGEEFKRRFAASTSTARVMLPRLNPLRISARIRLSFLKSFSVRTTMCLLSTIFWQTAVRCRA